VGEARQATPGRFKQAPYAVLVRDLGAVEAGFDHQPLGIHEDVALRAANLLAAVEAPLLAADARGLHRLRIHDAGAGLGVPTKLLR